MIDINDLHRQQRMALRLRELCAPIEARAFAEWLRRGKGCVQRVAFDCDGIALHQGHHARLSQHPHVLDAARRRKGVAFRDPLAVRLDGVAGVGVAQAVAHILADEMHLAVRHQP